MIDITYAAGMMQLWENSAKYGWKVELLAIKNESLIQRARNALADMFMKGASPGDKLMFIDADIQFPWQGIIALANTGFDICGAIYRKKGVNWRKVARAIAENRDPTVVGDFVIDPIRGQLKVEKDCIPVRYMGTGFMMLSHQLMADMVKSTPVYVSDSSDTHGMPMSNLFQCPVDGDRLLSEDYFFCHRAIELGYQPMAHIGIKLGHTGSHTFIGDVRTELGEP